MKLKTPHLKEYYLIATQEKKYTLFPKGLEVYFYRNDPKDEGFLKANWAAFSEEIQIYKAKGEVLIQNAQGDELKTSCIFWDRKKKKIYTYVESHIKRANGSVLHAKNGLEGSEDLRNILLRNVDGHISLPEKIPL